MLGVLFIVFVAIMWNKNAEGCIGQLLGLSGKNDILTFLGLSMGGVLLALQAVIANIRAKAMENAANAQADVAAAQARAIEEQAKANDNTEKGQRQERLKNAIEHLGHTSESVRLGGAYELFHLAQDIKEWRETIFSILCAHIRQTTSQSNYKEKYKSKPSEEIQSLLTLLFVQKHEIFKGLRINLDGSRLVGAHLMGAQLKGAFLFDTQLQKARLNAAQLQGAALFGTQLQEAHLGGAQLQGAVLTKACLQGAILIGAQLQGAHLFEAQLQGANLVNGQLQGAHLVRTELQGVDLGRAQLQGVPLNEAQFQGAVLNGAQLQGVSSNIGWFSFEDRIENRINRIVKRINKESDLSGAVLRGGLAQEDLNSLVEGLSEDKASELRAKLMPHLDKPVSNELPEDSGAITGSYTKEEAQQWIAEYNKAIGESSRERNS